MKFWNFEKIWEVFDQREIVLSAYLFIMAIHILGISVFDIPILLDERVSDEYNNVKIFPGERGRTWRHENFEFQFNSM